LKNIDVKELDDFSEIDKIIDPTKIELLDIGKITANYELLSYFINLRDLIICN
jgi:hypothetical protein